MRMRFRPADISPMYRRVPRSSRPETRRGFSHQSASERGTALQHALHYYHRAARSRACSWSSRSRRLNGPVSLSGVFTYTTLSRCGATAGRTSRSGSSVSWSLNKPSLLMNDEIRIAGRADPAENDVVAVRRPRRSPSRLQLDAISTTEGRNRDLVVLLKVARPASTSDTRARTCRWRLQRGRRTPSHLPLSTRRCVRALLLSDCR